MDTLFNNTDTNPRGIPAAPFVEDISSLFPKEQHDNDFNLVFNKFQERLQKYKVMQQYKQTTLKQLQSRIPEIEQSLKIVQLLNQQQHTDALQFNYSLNDTLFTKATVNPQEVHTVGLWLGADVMLQYPINEAISLLQTKLKDNKISLNDCTEDLEFLRENITTMEVMCARVYNFDVERRIKSSSN